MHVIDTLAARGFIQQSTGLDSIREAMDQGPLTFYVGFDPSADSLHVGHLVQALAMRWLQQAGHRAIALVGGGTAMVGDPSGRTELRQMLTLDSIAANARGMQGQLERVLVLDGEQGLLVNNAEWLMKLEYIPFLREIGSQFSVNRMLAAEAYRQRLARGLSFIEFNYQLLQAYDYLELYRRFGCTLQVGGDDQWGNILAGTDLVRRMEGADVFGLTTPLLTTASGAKMGKTAQGALWLSADRLAPFAFFQYWINAEDEDVGRFLRMFTTLPLEEIAALEALEGADIRTAKRRLAWECTALVHGAAAADEAEAGARAMVAGQATDDLPTHLVDPNTLAAGVRIYLVLQDAGLTSSRGEGRRLIRNGGVRLDNLKVTDAEQDLTAQDIGLEGVVLRVGKKRAVRVVSSR
ncbi:MAG: tyrosine--tRNA ligase [Deltaproteobacteria bacterium]|nr:tyrosine--tRNA ligase [Deltaproteobacteria bacterium]MBW2257455.1 tyrosine--tRNA ligase [Deltaproteobacteria bacterium]